MKPKFEGTRKKIISKDPMTKKASQSWKSPQKVTAVEFRIEQRLNFQKQNGRSVGF